MLIELLCSLRNEERRVLVDAHVEMTVGRLQVELARSLIELDPEAAGDVVEAIDEGVDLPELACLSKHERDVRSERPLHLCYHSASAPSQIQHPLHQPLRLLLQGADVGHDVFDGA